MAQEILRRGHKFDFQGNGYYSRKFFWLLLLKAFLSNMSRKWDNVVNNVCWTSIKWRPCHSLLNHDKETVFDESTNYACIVMPPGSLCLEREGLSIIPGTFRTNWPTIRPVWIDGHFGHCNILLLCCQSFESNSALLWPSSEETDIGGLLSHWPTISTPSLAFLQPGQLPL